MCAQLSKSLLNPNASEYRPSHLPPAVVSPPLKFLPQSPFQSPCYYSSGGQGFIPYYDECTQRQWITNYPLITNFIPIPASPGFLYEPIRVPTPISREGSGVNDEIKTIELEMLEAPIEPRIYTAPGKRKGRKRDFPPRLRRPDRSYYAAKKPESEWRPAKQWHASSKAYGNGVGAAYASPSLSGNEYSASSNTTVMIKNIPNKLRRDFMLKFLDYYCRSYSLEYDFLYLPMDFRKAGNLGYAFVNFTSTAAALRFKEAVDKYSWRMVCTHRGPITSNKVCEVTWARIQGKEALIKRFENSSFYCDNMEFLPVLLDPPRNGSGSDLSPPVVLGKLQPRHCRKIY